MLVKQKVIGVFEENKKNMFTKQATFKARSFSSNFNFAYKDDRVTIATC